MASPTEEIPPRLDINAKMGSMSLPREARKPWIETPLVESTTLSKAAGCRIFLKLENLQPSSSFKSRGIGNMMLSAIDEQNNSADERPVHFYCSSGGNAGLACVTAANFLGYSATICVPTSTEESMIAKLRATGADDVIQHGPTWAHADEYLRKTLIPKAEKHGKKGIYVPPFDHPDVWQGASTMIDEIRDQMPHEDAPDAIICSVGGGGLFSGIMQGISRYGWEDTTKVLAVETKGADSLNQSVRERKLITLPGITSMATSLGAIRVAEQAFREGLKPNVTSLVLEDAEACMACWRFADDERFLIEPSCGASVALAYDGRLKRSLKGFHPESKVVIIVCGGSRVSLKLLQEWREKYGARAEELGLMGGKNVPSTYSV